MISLEKALLYMFGDWCTKQSYIFVQTTNQKDLIQVKEKKLPIAYRTVTFLKKESN